MTMETPGEIIDAKAFRVYGGFRKADLRFANHALGRPISGVQNADGHMLFMLYAKEKGNCGKCDDPNATYIIEEVDHTGLTQGYAHLCRNCLPNNLLPQGD